MLNYLWSFMILAGIFYAALTGRLTDVTNGVLDSSKEAITLCITMMGIMSFWSGLMEIASESGILKGASRRIRPLLFHEFSCQLSWPWMGCHAGRSQGNGVLAAIGSGQKKS